MVEKSDEFDERMLNRQKFSYQNIALRKFRYYIFYGYNLLTWVCQGLSSYVGAWILKYFHPITNKKDVPEDKDPPEGKEWLNLPGSYIFIEGYSIIIVINCQL